ncbi:class I SAM-dependent methyltransferase [Thermococcus henrietii]|uniref:class I SAM-dependent methyltransferase n=1 Tax=Thermococcus henrietii TaxID=2016361 RepID=UPI00131417B8|nr:class I SAM-dependent methyltransferase [Thermococcus henrietii]
MKYDLASYVYEPINGLLERPTGIKKARKKLISQAKGRVLELGVGTGLNLPLYRNVEEVIGLDISRKMLKKARRKRAEVQVKLIQADARDLPFPDRSFDTIVSTFFLCVVPEKEKVIQEIKRVLKPNGFLLAMECSPPENRAFRALLSGVSVLTSRLTGTDFRIDLPALFRREGFNVEEEGLVNGAVRLIRASPERE